MNRIFITLATCVLLVSSSWTLHATNHHLTTADNISSAITAASSGDTIYLAAGTYNQAFSVKAGVHVVGVKGQTILDGTGLNKRLVSCSSKLAQKTVIQGLYLCNANHAQEGGGAYLTANAHLYDCIIELCTTTATAGGIYNNGGVVDRCIVRGCLGSHCSIYNENNGQIRNCLIHNNQPIREDWPSSGGVYNPEDGNLDGVVSNCTSACNYGAQYAGWHSESCSYNIITWNNKKEVGFSDPANYISGDAAKLGAKPNASDDGFESSCFNLKINKENYYAKRGVCFVAPTPFVGVPTNEAEIAAMRNADFHLSSSSYMIDRGKNDDVSPLDLDGNPRQIGDKMDLGCYEYDPHRPQIALQDVQINADTFRVVEEQKTLAIAVFVPSNTTHRRTFWNTDDPRIATVKDGLITGVKAGTTILNLISYNGRIRRRAVIVVEPKEEVIVHPDVIAADENYHIEDYAIPSYIPMWVAKEAARRDSSKENLDTLRMRIAELLPKQTPYCAVANINGDPKTRMAFCWFTNEGVDEGEVQILPQADATEEDFETSQDLLRYSATPTTTRPLRYAVSTSGLIKATGMSVAQAYKYVSHKALADNLTPGTQYSYRVGMSGHWSSIRHFRTSDEEQGEYSFLYMTDSHLMDREYVNNAYWCSSAVAKNENDIRFCLFPGDFVETGSNANSEWEWERWFEEAIRPVIEKMPIVPTDGNHDDTPNLNYTYHFNTDNQFNLISKVKPQFQGITYSFMYGDVLFLVYSHQDYWRGSYDYTAGTSKYLQTDVANWFKDQVAAHPEAKWRVALVHQAVFCGSGHQIDDAGTLYRSCMTPIFKDIELDLLIQGHDHCYEVIGPVDPDSYTVVSGSVMDVDTVSSGGSSANMSGYKNGTFKVDDGTLYFVGATCGRKRYDPYSRNAMEESINRHHVENYFDLFTGLFGQPGAPSYTRFTVKDNCLEANSFTTNKDGESMLYNTFKVIRTKPHTAVITSLPKNHDLRGVNAVYDIFGRKVSQDSLGTGMYITVKDNKVKKMVIH